MNAAADLAARQARWHTEFSRLAVRAKGAHTLTVEGRLRRVVGLMLEAEGCEAALGARDEAAYEREPWGFDTAEAVLAAQDHPSRAA